jgi:hypothetical protein
VHFTVQSNHLHLICEAPDRMALARGMQGLAIRIAKRLNLRLARRGRLFAERYHARALKTPTEVRNALRTRSRATGSTAAPRRPGSMGVRAEGEVPVVAAGTWLLEKGWRRRGLIGFGERPGAKG